VATSWPGCAARPEQDGDEPKPACYNKVMKRKHNHWFEPMVAILVGILEAIIGSFL
jgi:hypothetical protein